MGFRLKCLFFLAYANRLRLGAVHFGRISVFAHTAGGQTLLTELRKMISPRYFSIFLCIGLLALQGCTVLAVADAVGTVAVGTAGLVADAAVGTVRLGGRAIGAVAGAALPATNDEKK